ncbi:MAG: PSD1 domain-containing protein [Planctomycetes bacterium]|nr:PSD1 domain-containing protein [Planctomycetota bacterium]
MLSSRIPLVLCFCAPLLGTLASLAAPAAGPRDVRYGRDIRPILSDRCVQCHGPDPDTREAGLRLDTRAGALADLGGHAAIVPGDVEASELWQRIASEDPDDVMPPAHAKKRPLSADERAKLAAWIEQGAPYEEHWAFIAPEKHAPPAVRDAAWVRDELDAFVLARLEAEGLAPSPEADRATLLRRVFLDLTGLPPTLDELDAFLADARPDAYEREVERLFAEEPYRSRIAERLATPWLDAARYADTCGIHTDAGRQAWHWRDWVLAALRDDMPFDRFVTEQLAGDLLPEPTKDQLVATGFHRNQVTTDEGGAINEEYLVEYAADRVNTTGAVFLGLTVGCARCHDHKYDPLTMADYYGLMAFFNSVDQPGLYSQLPDPTRAHEPFTEVPTAEQSERLDAIATRLTEVEGLMAAPLPGEEASRAAFTDELWQAAGLDWHLPRVLAADSSDAHVDLVEQPDGSLLATGPMPAVEDYVVQLESDVADARLLLLEALVISDEHPGPGRADHKNAVVSRVTLEQRPKGSDAAFTPVALRWAWADHTQRNQDYEAIHLLQDGAMGWALDGHRKGGGRALMLLADEPFGDAAGSELRVVISFRSIYERHSLGRIRLRVSPLADTARLPVSYGRWYTAGDYRLVAGDERSALYDKAYGPEAVTAIDPGADLDGAGRKWTFEGRLVDGAVVTLADGVSANFVGREVWSPDARDLDVSLGSDDGLVVLLNGEVAFERRVDRGAAPDQDRATLHLRPGRNSLVLRVVNTGGPSGYYFSELPAEPILVEELPSLLLPQEAISPEQDGELLRSWRRRYFDDFRALDDEAVALRTERDALQAEVPRAMVMRELAMPRPQFVLKRGQYDAPDETRPVGRHTPGFLPPMPAGAPANRLGFAEWLVAPENPLFARVSVNRFWQTVFGRGLVATPGDFGLQGEWPTHPELLDTLSVEFRESGWDVHALMKRLVCSATYRQSSRVRPELAERDPENRLLARYPRRRLGAEELRDQALYVAGLLVEQLGGASVKPYQPEGLWREVAMPQSNTRTFERGRGDDLWRRSLYTYWKRAVPPPALLTFDAPTRESCVVQRQTTNTPLQALVLWNDEQHLEAARALAARLLARAGDDAARLTDLMRSLTARAPEPEELELFELALDGYRERYRADEAAAAALLATGETPRPMDVDAAELASWTLVASAAMNLHETLTID